jgi:dipeptidyl aminopeptidase/acylaminoacyl peptidase
VLQVNFRGSDNRGRDFERSGDGEWGRAMQDDVTDATRWAIEQKIAPANGICIYGASYGGYAALEGAVREPTLYRCAIGYAGVYDLELMFTTSDVPRSKSGRVYLERMLGTDKNEWHARSPVYNADKIQVPVLLIHGKADWRADFEQATRMKAALEKNHKQFEWMALKREGHGVFDEESRREVYTRILEFLDHNIGGARTAAN